MYVGRIAGKQTEMEMSSFNRSLQICMCVNTDMMPRCNTSRYFL